MTVLGFLRFLNLFEGSIAHCCANDRPGAVSIFKKNGERGVVRTDMNTQWVDDALD